MKRLFVSILVLLIVIVTTQNVFAMIHTDQNPSIPSGGDPIDGVAVTTRNAWATVRVIVQIVSVACVVFAGLRYMFASADQKADIKQGLMYLCIGAVLVFGATTIINFVVNATKELTTISQ